MIFNKGAKATRWRKDDLFIKWFWDNWISPRKKVNLNIDP